MVCFTVIDLQCNFIFRMLWNVFLAYQTLLHVDQRPCTCSLQEVFFRGSQIGAMPSEMT